MKAKVLITDVVHPLLLEGLESRNYEVDYQPDISLAETHERIAGYQALVINTKTLADRKLIERGIRLRWIARLGSGMEIIDHLAARERGLHLISTPEANCNAVAEHALGMLLGLFRNIPRADRELREKRWEREKNRGEELAGKTLGIIGFGHTGSRFCELLQGLSVKILVYDKYKQLSSQAGRYTVVNAVSEIQQSADVISLHLPLTPETNGLITGDFIAGCRKSFYLINTSRGKIVETHALMRGLREGKLKGACLDVFENEKPATFSPEEEALYAALYRMEQVILSPHIAGWTHQSKQKIAETILEKLDRIEDLV